jgi:hypothetical protein
MSQSFRPANRWSLGPVRPDADLAVDWRHESVVGALVVVFSTLLGGAVGPVWHALAPRLNVVGAFNGSSAATKLLVGDDLWLGLVGILAGVVCVLALVTAFPDAARGPGAVIGLAVGGVLGSIVAAHIGHQIGHRQITSGFHRSYPGASPSLRQAFLGLYDFRVRAHAVLVGWPLAAVACVGLVTVAGAFREAGQSTAGGYPGSS